MPSEDSAHGSRPLSAWRCRARFGVLRAPTSDRRRTGSRRACRPERLDPLRGRSRTDRWPGPKEPRRAAANRSALRPAPTPRRATWCRRSCGPRSPSNSLVFASRRASPIDGKRGMLPVTAPHPSTRGRNRRPAVEGWARGLACARNAGVARGSAETEHPHTLRPWQPAPLAAPRIRRASPSAGSARLRWWPNRPSIRGTQARLGLVLRPRRVHGSLRARRSRGRPSACTGPTRRCYGRRSRPTAARSRSSSATP